MILYRTTIINPISASKCQFFQDGAILIKNKKIVYCGNYKKFPNTKIFDYREKVIIPGFCDTHIHLPQFEVRGTFSGTKLLPWLKKYIWPEEAKFLNTNHAKKVSQKFYKDLIKNETLNTLIWGTIHEKAVEIMFNTCPIRAIIGKVMMDQNSSKELLETTKKTIKITENLAKKYKQNFAVTPRFAPTCSFESMKQAAKIAKKYKTYIQTHINENKDEIKWVKKLFPKFKSYTEVYQKAALLTEKTILAHMIHFTQEELKIIKKTKTKITHCPTSNIALKSGRMPIEKLLQEKIPFAISTDVGAGPDTSMFDVMKAFIKIHKKHKKITPTESLYYATLAGAQILGWQKQTGNLIKGKSADLLILDTKAQKNDTANTILQKIMQKGKNYYDNIIYKTIFQGKEIYKK